MTYNIASIKKSTGHRVILSGHPERHIAERAVTQLRLMLGKRNHYILTTEKVK